MNPYHATLHVEYPCPFELSHPIIASNYRIQLPYPITASKDPITSPKLTVVAADCRGDCGSDEQRQEDVLQPGRTELQHPQNSVQISRGRALNFNILKTLYKSPEVGH